MLEHAVLALSLDIMFELGEPNKIIIAMLAITVENVSVTSITFSLSMQSSYSSLITNPELILLYQIAKNKANMPV